MAGVVKFLSVSLSFAERNRIEPWNGNGRPTCRFTPIKPGRNALRLLPILHSMMIYDICQILTTTFTFKRRRLRVVGGGSVVWVMEVDKKVVVIVVDFGRLW